MDFRSIIYTWQQNFRQIVMKVDFTWPRSIEMTSPLGCKFHLRFRLRSSIVYFYCSIATFENTSNNQINCNTMYLSIDIDFAMIRRKKKLVYVLSIRNPFTLKLRKKRQNEFPLAWPLLDTTRIMLKPISIGTMMKIP